MIRAVLDTNVYVAALLSREGSPAAIVRAFADGIFDAVVCPHLLRELEDVLARPKIVRHVSPDIALAYTAWLTRVAVVESDPRDVPRLSPDPDDDFIVALAVAARAQVIVSGDAQLLGLSGVEPRVMAPTAFAIIVDGLR